MLSQHAPCGVENRTRAQCVRMEPRHHVGIGAPRDKADLLAVRFVSYRKRELPCELAHLPLRMLTDREPHPAQLRLGKPVEDIGLVLVLVARPQQTVPTADRITLDARVVPGGDTVQSQRGHLLQQERELDGLVAGNAGIARSPHSVLSGAVADYSAI